jgi:hypothetical protein
MASEHVEIAEEQPACVLSDWKIGVRSNSEEARSQGSF